MSLFIQRSRGSWTRVQARVQAHVVSRGTCPRRWHQPSTSAFSTTSQSQDEGGGRGGGDLKIWEISATSQDHENIKRNSTLFTSDLDQNTSSGSKQWNIEEVQHQEPLTAQQVSRRAVTLFLPAKYPESVAPGYLKFASLCFTASVAGSAAMVLSTQTLLLAVGIVGSNAQHAGIMAGALNWVLKDGIGQLGGVLFASQMGKTKTFDADPKRWRMVAAVALDSATLLEILSPLFHSSLVLPVASIANIGKNIGFLTASASRAAIHQSLAITSNLGDVTAKAGSQSIVASLVGTTIGIGLSSLLSHDVYNFSVGFGVLALIHQGSNYLSLKSVPLIHFNRHRLHLVLTHYLEHGDILSPKDVSEKEVYIPFLPADEFRNWLTIGPQLPQVCATPEEWKFLRSVFADEQHIATINPDGRVYLLFKQGAEGSDIVRGMMHAYLMKSMVSAVEDPDLIVIESHRTLRTTYSDVLEQLQESGWKVSGDMTTVEGSKAKRIKIEDKQS